MLIFLFCFLLLFSDWNYAFFLNGHHWIKEKSKDDHELGQYADTMCTNANLITKANDKLNLLYIACPKALTLGPAAVESLKQSGALIAQHQDNIWNAMEALYMKTQAQNKSLEKAVRLIPGPCNIPGHLSWNHSAKLAHAERHQAGIVVQNQNNSNFYWSYQSNSVRPL